MSAFEDIWQNLGRIVPSLNSSKGGIIHRISEVVGTFIDIVRLELLRSEQVITEAARIARVTTRKFYIDMAYYYQDGANLEVINKSTQELGYTTIDPSKQIIKQASIGVSSIGVFFLNVATADRDRNIVPLSVSQLDAFKEYYDNFMAMGAQCSIASNEPAVLTCETLTIRYEKTYNLDFIKATISDALHELQIIARVDATLYVNEIEGFLTNLPGMRDAYFNGLVLMFRGSTSYPENGSVFMQPGYFNFDPELYDFTKNKTRFEAI